MKKILLFPAACFSVMIFAQHTVSGIVVDEMTQKPLQGVMVAVQSMNAIANTNVRGQFSFVVKEDKVKLIIGKRGYESQEIDVKLPITEPILVSLVSKVTDIDEVALSTGYQKIPKERATGSFTTVTASELDKQVSTNIMDRLESLASGVFIDKGTSQTSSQLTVRGLSSIRGPKGPLIVVDNFPYEGDVKNINPNIVESVTILKDAAASSIWGARAANGVIVITTKVGKLNQAVVVDFNTSMTTSMKPDLSYLPQMSSADYIDVEQELFSRNFYNSDINSSLHPVLSPVVDLLNKEKKGLLSHDVVAQEINRLKTIDVRDQYRKYMYLPLDNRQYALNLSGGAQKIAWTSTIGYDDNTGNLGEQYQRLNFRLQNTWQALKNLSITAGMYFTNTSTKSGRSGYGTATIKSNGVPYMEFADANGNALAMPKQYNQDFKNSLSQAGLYDWNYYPLTDWQHSVNTSRNSEIMINAGANYKIIKGLELDFKYQYVRSSGRSNTLYDEESYYTRDNVNFYTVINKDGSLTYNMPKGAIMGESFSVQNINNYRGQLNFNRSWGLHAVSAIFGGEIRDNNVHTASNRYYGYNENNLTFGIVDYSKKFPALPGGTAFIYNGASLRETNRRFVSSYANASYTYANRYTLSGSARKDASNLFGLKTNDQWNPFWSTGLAWNVSREDFYNLTWLPQLKFRGSYGFNGNINPAMVAVTTIAALGTSQYTNSPMARFDNYYNPNLRWETIRMLNVGADFATKNNRITGSIEYFQKKGENLFGQVPLDYTIGISSLIWNVAGMKGNGLDINLRTININKGIKWQTMLNFSTYHDKVTKYYQSNTLGQQFVGSTVLISGVEGLPVYSMFGYKWAGLDAKTGDPQGYLDGKISKDYGKIVGVGTDVKDLQYFGSAIPTVYGSMTNSLSYKRFALDFGLSYKFGYYFRKPSIKYTSLFKDWIGHSDYALRWQKPGDELFTNVPSNQYKTDSNRDNFYAGSSVLVEKGDHIRLQYINVSYDLSQQQWTSLPLRNLQLYANISNLGILWRANKNNIDPDYNLGINAVKPPLYFTFGLKAKF